MTKNSSRKWWKEETKRSKRNDGSQRPGEERELVRCDSSVGSLFLEGDNESVRTDEERDLKQRHSQDVTVPVLDDFDIADYDLDDDDDDDDIQQNAPSPTTRRSWRERFAPSSSNNNNSDGDDNDTEPVRHYSYSELVATLGHDSVDLKSLHPTLERRVRDFRFAQRKRREKEGTHKPWGIFGLYAHLASIRADLEWAEDAAWRREHGEPYFSWKDYEKARNKGMNRPFFTYLTMFVSTIMMIVTFSLNNWKIEPLSINPLIGPSAEVLIEAGARESSLIVNEGQWFRLLSPVVLHAGVIHFVINMLALWFIGAAVEQSHGFASASILFFIPAVGGNILSAIFLPQYISVGASGGIFGLIGGCIADIVLNWKLLFIKGENDSDSQWGPSVAFFWLIFDILINCVIGFTPFVDNFTHLGGLLYGICCGISTIERLAVGFFGIATGRWSAMRNNLVRFCGLIFSVFLIMITTALLVQSDGSTSPCPSCRFVSCVPFPFGSDDPWWSCDDCDFAVADLVKLHATSVHYDRIDMTCPDGEIELIDITEQQLSDREDIRRKLPRICRDNCEDKYSN